MKPETGSNTQITKDGVSIQLYLDGHYSSFDTLRQTKDEDKTTLLISIATPSTVLIPEPMYSPQIAQPYAERCGLYPQYGQVLVSSEPFAGTIALMWVDKDLVDSITAQMGCQPRFSSPLLPLGHEGETKTYLQLSGDVLFVKVYTPELTYAKALYVTSTDEVMFCLATLNRDYRIFGGAVEICGTESKLLKKSIKRYCKNISICES